jgi:hypothetical protein
VSPCAVALILLLDASGSVRADDWTLQLHGHAAAFEGEDVARITAREPVAVTALAFSDSAAPLVGWRMVRGGADARAFAAELRGADRGPAMGTNIGAALMAGLRALASAPCIPDQPVMDLVTDGEAPEEPARRARDAAEAQGVRINAIGVGSDSAVAWLRENAVTAGGFAMAASDWHDVARALRSKITLELAAR